VEVEEFPRPMKAWQARRFEAANRYGRRFSGNPGLEGARQRNR
jgi:hypothetical protein